MTRNKVGLALRVSLLLAGMALVVSACAPAAAPAPTAAPAKPAAAAPTTAPAAAPAKAAEPAKAATPAVDLKVGCSFAKGDIYCDGFDKFAELLQQKSGGAMKATVSYQSLGVEQQLAESVMAGSVDMGNLSNGNCGRFTNAYYIYDMPFLFKDNAAMLKWKVGPEGKALDEQFGKDLGLVSLMAASQGGGRDVYTRSKPVRVPNDIKGSKIRAVSTPIDLATWKAWGANPTPVDAAQTVTALQQGVVDGMGGTAVFMLTSKWYEPLKYAVHIEYQQMFQAIYMNAKKFASFSPEQQKLILDSAKEAEAWQHNHAFEKAKTGIADLTKLGIGYHEPTKEEMAQWSSIRESVWNEVAEALKDKIDINVVRKVYAAQ